MVEKGRKEGDSQKKTSTGESNFSPAGVAAAKKPNKKKRKNSRRGRNGFGTMWAVRSILRRDRDETAITTPKEEKKPKTKKTRSKDMNNDRTLDVREMTEIPRTGDCDRPEKHLLEDNRYNRPYRPGIDVNLYATKKSVAQGMMDIALLTANASQLKYILKEGEDSRFYFVNVICIGISIALQLIVGVLLILNTRYNINLVSHQSRAELVNNLTIIGIFLITVSNVFVSAFGSSPR
ncbi:hypothetical protein JTE90_015880 [Oedothorax gibbosus]|uniref:Ninjurin-1 n=1 Tax=Oedothorax gibbosus TaxID=931172 RepID=A0AAV6VTA7_9ARAC|nr:hypothetical protein JTE90_015880 [Oedothorax gibbosus]